MGYCCVIGGNGFIGSHLVELLLASGRSVRVVARKKKSFRSLPRNIDLCLGDYSEKSFLKLVLEDADEVVDLAYATIPSVSAIDPVNDIQANLPSKVNLFEEALKCNVKKVVFVSSGGAIYGDAITESIREDHQKNPISSYGITKLAIEKYAFMYYMTRGLPVICVRPSNPFGVGQLPFTGQGLIATAIGSILHDKEIRLFGGKNIIRDYIYISDLVEGIFAALENGKNGEAYNIGSGHGVSNQDVIDSLASFLKDANLKIKVVKEKCRPYDVRSNVLCCQKLTDISGWKCKVGFLEGLNIMWHWFVSENI